MAERGDHQGLEDLVGSVLDGRPIDWDAAESRASDRDRRLVRQLRVVSTVAEVYRSIGSGLSPGPVVPPLLPSSWGPLDLIEHVGRGSFGDVYRAWDRRLDREVALKLLHQEEIASDTAPSIISEGRLLARVRHPNVVTIHGADRLDGRVGLWMEFVRGRTLEQLLAERGPFGSQEALLVGVDLCRALSAVHGAGVVHRDIKAQNVVREEGGRIVLMDFGTGREPADAAGESTLSGTPLYVAPELFQGGHATRQSDIYSLGVLLFHLVSRSYPVSGASVDDVRRGHREGRRTWLRDLRPDLPERFIRVIERALAPDPAGRYQSAGEMEQALLAAISGLEDLPVGPAASTPETAIAITPVVPRSTPGRTPAWWLGFAAVAATVIVGVLTLGPRLRQAGGSFRSPTAQGSRGAAAPDLAARRVSLPETMFVGRPSPDGRYLSYVDLNADLCLHDLATGQNRCLTSKGQSAEGAESQIAVSRDGQWIAYTWRTLDRAHELRVIGQEGTWPRLVLRRADVAFPSPLQWSTDGTHILAMLELTSGNHQLVLISAATGAVQPLRTFEGGQYHPALSPDGRFVAFHLPQSDETYAHDIFVMRVDTIGEPRPIIQHAANDLFPIWTSDGRLLFVSDRTGSLALWGVEIVEGQPIGDPDLLVPNVGRLAMPLGLTSAGKLYYRVQNGMVDVYSQSIDLSGRTPPGSPAPVAPLLVGSNISSEWSPDGRHLAYVSLRGWVQNDRYSRDLVIRDVTAGTQRHLRPPLNFFIGPRWSPDGRTVLVRGTDLRSREGIFAVDVETGRTGAAILFPIDTVQSAVFQWSPDGQAIWYDKSGARAIVARDLASGRERVVIDYRGTDVQRLAQWPGFRISRDGTSVAYTGFTFENNKAGTVVHVRSIGAPPVEVARASDPESVEFQDWTADGQGILLIRRNRKERRNLLYEAHLDGRAMRPLGVSAPAIRDLALRRDGEAITYTAGASSLEVWVLENFLTKER